MIATCLAPIEAARSEPTTPREDPWAHYCITRRDLPRGVQAAQLIHAAGHSSPGSELPHGTLAIALTCADEVELCDLYRKLRMSGIRAVAINEPDSPYDGQLMAIGLPPAYRSTYRRFTSNLPLLK